jgi:hypothetical protein
MLWLIKTNFAAARQQDRSSNSPRFLFDLGAADILRLQQLQIRVQFLAHQIKVCAKKLATSMELLWGVFLDRMECSLGRWKGEDQPASSSIDGVKSEDVATEGAVCFRIVAVEKNVGAGNHAVSLTGFSCSVLRKNKLRF